MEIISMKNLILVSLIGLAVSFNAVADTHAVFSNKTITIAEDDTNLKLRFMSKRPYHSMDHSQSKAKDKEQAWEGATLRPDNNVQDKSEAVRKSNIEHYGRRPYIEQLD
jgi:hypothetical protein